MKGFNEVMEMAADHFGIKSGDEARVEDVTNRLE